MGKLLRSWKYELSTKIRKIIESRSTNVERTNLLAKLRPHDVSSKEWDKFVQSRPSDKWTAKSLKMREIRSKQTITHTLSRKGYNRKEDEHNKLNPDKPLTKPQLWIEAHVSKKKTSATNTTKIEEIQMKMEKAPPNGDEEDILTQVLEAALASKLGINLDDDESEDASESGEEDTQGNSKGKSISGAIESTSPNALQKETMSGQESTHQPSIHDKCNLINWNGNGEVVAKGSISAVDPKAVVHGYVLGPDCYRVSIEEVLVENAEFYRYEPEFTNPVDSIGSTIAWPSKCIVIDG